MKTKIAFLCFVASLPILSLVIAQEPFGAVELTVMPTEGQSVGVVRTATEGRWIVFGEGLMPVQNVALRLESGGTIVLWEGEPGSVYGVIFIADAPLEGIAAKRVQLGTAPRPPPDPDTPPDPDVPIPDDAEGMLSVIIVRNAEDLTADQAAVILDARTWIDAQDQSRVQGFIFDVEQAKGKGWLQATDPIPIALVVQDRDDGKGARIRWKGPLPEDAKAIESEVSKWLK